MAKGKLYTALYERLSHDDELQENLTVSLIRSRFFKNMQCRARHSLTPVRHFTDDGISRYTI